MIRFRRRRFAELVDRQLDLFAADEAASLEEVRLAREAWTSAPREEAEEAFGDLQLVVDAIAEQLLELRETYASTLDEEAGDAYRADFNRLAAARFRDYTELLE